ncbi:hypothetical protein [Solimonas terrae]|uniref:HD/PDEase domain-containing protein n=1 Tax=Solimonas terrae TaxID=1396819 RepID=A0A6M2BVH3_9GAMM|nr:hypothetical protein [Solimonas terrae]NGY05957.1 hypothetical protein [Solimonas terrae]
METSRASPARRRNHYDVTDRVQISHPRDVCTAVCDLLAGLYPDADLAAVRQAFATFGRLYAGTLPGYAGCDTWYHDAQHSLDCALAMMRLLDGHERSVPAAQKLGAHRAVLGVLIALFHDAGYIRRRGDHAVNGAEFTLTHVYRSGEFLGEYLPKIGYGDDVAKAQQIVHFTGYEIALDKIRVRDGKDRMLGFLLGSADVLAQTADRCYLEKCRDFLFREFALCGLAGARRTGGPTPIYGSSRELLEKTVDFNRALWDERLDGYFGGAHRFLDVHFGGPNPYGLAIAAHLARIEKLVRRNRLGELKLRPVAIGRDRLRRIIGTPSSRVNGGSRTLSQRA